VKGRKDQGGVEESVLLNRSDLRKKNRVGPKKTRPKTIKKAWFVASRAIKKSTKEGSETNNGKWTGVKGKNSRISGGVSNFSRGGKKLKGLGPKEANKNRGKKV